VDNFLELICFISFDFARCEVTCYSLFTTVYVWQNIADRF